MIGVKSSENIHIKFPLPLFGPKGYVRKSYRGAEECMLDLQDPNEKYKPYGGVYEDYLLEIPPGMNYLYFTEKMGHPTPHFAWRSRFSDFLYVADPQMPTKTIVASPGKWCGPFHWKKRKFSVEELKRLFTFPDKYILTGVEAMQIKQLGNSVPSLFGFNMALAVMMQCFSDRCNANIKLADDGFTYNLDSRKGQKARATRAKVKPNISIAKISNQLEFQWDEEEQVVYPNIKKTFNAKYLHPRKITKDEYSSKYSLLVTFDATLKDGIWNVDVSTDSLVGVEAILKIDFIKIIGGSFKQIVINGKNIPDDYVAVMWDAVDFCVNTSSSYDSIQKLYGHFAEPYPQFSASLDIVSVVKGPYFLFAQALLQNSELKDIQTLDSFAAIQAMANNLPEIVKLLREHGFDIRSNETNRTIQNGKIKVCYPFTMSLNEMRFTSWHERGTHKTADNTSIPNTEKLIK